MKQEKRSKENIYIVISRSKCVFCYEIAQEQVGVKD